jgi:hypothetical protein
MQDLALLEQQRAVLARLDSLDARFSQIEADLKGVRTLSEKAT